MTPQPDEQPRQQFDPNIRSIPVGNAIAIAGLTIGGGVALLGREPGPGFGTLLLLIAFGLLAASMNRTAVTLLLRGFLDPLVAIYRLWHTLRNGRSDDAGDTTPSTPTDRTATPEAPAEPAADGDDAAKN